MTRGRWLYDTSQCLPSQIIPPASCTFRGQTHKVMGGQRHVFQNLHVKLLACQPGDICIPAKRLLFPIAENRRGGGSRLSQCLILLGFVQSIKLCIFTCTHLGKHLLSGWFIILKKTVCPQKRNINYSSNCLLPLSLKYLSAVLKVHDWPWIPCGIGSPGELVYQNTWVMLLCTDLMYLQ